MNDAEIEDKKQRAFLEGAGCAAMQGYLYSPPVPADEMEALLRIAPVAHLDRDEDSDPVDDSDPVEDGVPIGSSESQGADPSRF